MKILLFLSALIILSQFRADLNGKATIVGCFIRGLDAINDGRCNGSK